MHFKQVQKRSRQTRTTEVSMATRVISPVIPKARDIHGSRALFPQWLPLPPGTTWWYSDRRLCISATSSLEMFLTTSVRSYDASSSPSHAPSPFLTGGLRARETCGLEGDVGRCSHQHTFNLSKKKVTISAAIWLLNATAISRSVTFKRQREDSEISQRSRMHQSFAMQTWPLQSGWRCSPPAGACKTSRK